MTRLAKWETYMHYVLWFTFFICTMYKVHLDGNLLKRDILDSGDFVPGFFSWMDKDNSDIEWTLCTTWISILLPYAILHLIIAEITRFYDVEAVPFFYFLFTLCFSLFYFHLIISVIFIIHFVLFFLATIFGNKTIVWTLSLILLLISNLDILTVHIFGQQSGIWFYFVIYNWLIIKSTNFALVELNSNQSWSKLFSKSLGFSFYFPSFFFGPVIPYESFINNMYRPFVSWEYKRYLNFIKGILRVFLAYVSFEVFSQFLYCHSMHYYPREVLKLGYFTADGIGLCMSQFFYFKYLFVYGFSTTFVKAELYYAPPPPRCVHRIYLYSDMWRHFDHGFYLFMFNAIYKPVCGKSSAKLLRRLSASFLCFCFVFIWHGLNKTVLIWSILNFIGVAIEALGRAIAKTEYFKQFEATFSPRMFRRLKALICSPLLVMAIASNFVFFGGLALGKSYLQQLFSGDFLVVSHLVLIGYLMCQVSMEFPLNVKSKNV